MKTLILSIACLLICRCASVHAADLRLQFLFDGPAPVPKPLDVDRDKAVCGQLNLLDERLLLSRYAGMIWFNLVSHLGVNLDREMFSVVGRIHLRKFPSR